MNVLVIAAHPDDEVIGCGGTIARHIASGDKVYLLVMTQIYAPEWDMKEFDKRKKEAVMAAGILGIKKVFFGGFPTVKLNTIPTITLTRKISEIAKKVKPRIVYIPPKGDINVDHDIIHRTSIAACRPSFVSSVKKILSYEISPTSRLNMDRDAFFIPNHYVDITLYIRRKIQAMQAYKTEIRKYPHPRSSEGLKLFARERGITVGFGFAEAFSMVFNKE